MLGSLSRWFCLLLVKDVSCFQLHDLLNKCSIAVLGKPAPSLLVFPPRVSSRLTNPTLVAKPNFQFLSPKECERRRATGATAIFQQRSLLPGCGEMIEQVSIQGEYGAPIEKYTPARRSL